MGDGRKSSFAKKLHPIIGGGVTTLARGALNVLTWSELNGLGNLAKCEKIGLLCDTRLRVELFNDNSVRVLFVILERVRISRQIHYRRGVTEYNV